MGRFRTAGRGRWFGGITRSSQILWILLSGITVMTSAETIVMVDVGGEVAHLGEEHNRIVLLSLHCLTEPLDEIFEGFDPVGHELGDQSIYFLAFYWEHFLQIVLEEFGFLFEGWGWVDLELLVGVDGLVGVLDLAG